MRLLASVVLVACVGCVAANPKALVVQDDAKASTPTAPPAHEEAWHGHVPIGFWDTGICLGNSKDWNGLRLNWRDADLGTINGANVTLWKPGESAEGTVNGVGLGLIGNGASRLRGVFGTLGANAAERKLCGIHLAGLANLARESIWGIGAALLVNGARDSMVGVHLGGLMNGARGSITGVNVGGLLNGAGGSAHGLNLALLATGSGGWQAGINVAGLMTGAADSQTGINVAGLVSGAGRNTRGLTAALLTAGSGQDATGINLAGLTTGCGRDLWGLNFALMSAGAGRSVTGVTLGGLFVNAGGHTDESDAATDAFVKELADSIQTDADIGPAIERYMDAQAKAADAVGDPGSISGLALTAFRATAGSMRGVVAALGNVTADTFGGLGISLCTHIEKSQSGVTIGAFNHAETIDGFGFQLGLLNHIPTNPSWARWLPLVNWQM